MDCGNLLETFLKTYEKPNQSRVYSIRSGSLSFHLRRVMICLVYVDETLIFSPNDSDIDVVL